MKPHELALPLPPVDVLAGLFGPYDQNLRRLRDALDVRVVIRGETLRIQGESRAASVARNIIEDLLEQAAGGVTLDEIAFQHALRRHGTEAPAPPKPSRREDRAAPSAPRPPSKPAPLGRGHPVRARSPGQDKYLRILGANEVVLAYGPAGTGKTFLAVAGAVDALRRGAVRRIILTRPAVEAGERLGFLPGDYQAKVNPYLRPLYDALHALLEAGQLGDLIATEIVEIAPLAYMRGRTLDEAFVILDEAQNTTPGQMKMFLTRLGAGSRMVVTGDITQIDLPDAKTSGLVQAIKILRRTPGVGIMELTAADIVRHPLVQRILERYEKVEDGKRRRTTK